MKHPQGASLCPQVMAEKRRKKSMDGWSCRHGSYRDTRKRSTADSVGSRLALQSSLILGESLRQSNVLSLPT
uniref:Uncharacterized protein n=1 Tax=Salix viminalis TaxID=40686 RepID=A0A6N2LQ61_SALVM